MENVQRVLEAVAANRYDNSTATAMLNTHRNKHSRISFA